MSKEQFTQGDWELIGDTFIYALNDKGVNQFSLNIEGNAKYGADMDELLADALLIKTSPKLYYALKTLVYQHKKHFGLGGAWDECLLNAEKVLKEALGE